MSDGYALTQAVRNTTTVSEELYTPFAHGVLLVIGVVANPGLAETLSVNIQATQPETTNGDLVKFDVPGDTNGVYRLVMYPGIDVAEVNPTLNKGYSFIVPNAWRVNVIHSGAGDWEYYVYYELLE